MVKINKIILSVIALVILSFNVNAFGVSSPYWDDNPLYVQPGEIKEFKMILQNMVGDEDLTMIGELNSGNEIATITDPSTTYNVPLGSNNIPVNIKITIPQDAKPKQEWQVGVSFKTVTPNTGGVSIGGAIDKGFKVIVSEPPKVSAEVSKTEQGENKFTGFIILIIILIILIFIIKKVYKKRVNQ